MQKKARKMEYLSPKVSVSAFAPEQGFAFSTVTEDYGFSGTGSCMESYGETEPAAAAEGYGSFSF